jgi:hypothetical protein
VALARLTLCEWRGGRRSDHVVLHPSLADVEAAVRRLDNRAFNDLYLQPSAGDADTYLCVGGGAGSYLLAGSVGNQRFPTLVDPRLPAEPTELLFIGGQEGEYPRNWVHGLETALDTARIFWTAGGFDETGLSWVDT